jgi:hypothetical protein
MIVYSLGSQLTLFQKYQQKPQFPAKTSRQIFPAKIPSPRDTALLISDAASFSCHSPRLGGDVPAADSAASPLPAAGISGSRRSGGNYAARRRCRRRGGQRLPLAALHSGHRRRHRARQG